MSFRSSRDSLIPTFSSFPSKSFSVIIPFYPRSLALVLGHG
jgi:hypothetical protein